MGISRPKKYCLDIVKVGVYAEKVCEILIDLLRLVRDLF